jgi:hypothetical protein
MYLVTYLDYKRRGYFTERVEARSFDEAKRKVEARVEREVCSVKRMA